MRISTPHAMGQALEALHSPVSPVELLKSQSIVISYGSKQTFENFCLTRMGEALDLLCLSVSPVKILKSQCISHCM